MRTQARKKLEGLDVGQRLLALDTPEKVQGYLDSIPYNNSLEYVCKSPLEVLRQGNAHCFEGALLAYAALWLADRAPGLVNLRTDPKLDTEHVITVYPAWRHKHNIDQTLGAVAQSGAPVLRGRDPVYRSLRELAMSYFHFYVREDGVKSLRSYSEQAHPEEAFGTDWIFAEHSLEPIGDWLDEQRHQDLLKGLLGRVTRATPIEVAAALHGVTPETLESWKQ